MQTPVKTPVGERRNRNRTPRFLRQQVKLSYFNESGVAQAMSGRLVDFNDGGWGLELPSAVEVGTKVVLAGEALTKEAGGESHSRGRIAWCKQEGARWRAGVARGEAEPVNGGDPPSRGAAEADYYEMMQLSPNADQETIHRVYRLLAQRYHPDHQESGDAEMFRQLLEAYRTLGDAEKRAAYDVDHQALKRLRWRIFDQPKSAQGIEAEKRKRQGVLGLLYAKRANQPDQPALTLFEIEDLLGVPREHLEFCLWYLKENGLAVRGDNGRHAITAKGVDAVEQQQQDSRPTMRTSHLLPEASRPDSAAA